MSQPRSCACFTQKTKSRCFITHVLLADDLQCYGTAQIDVERLVSDAHRTATQLDWLPVFALDQLIVLKSLQRLFQCRLHSILETRPARRNPIGKSLAQQADRTEFHCSRKLVTAARAGALGLRFHGPKRPSAATRAESHTTRHRVVRNRPAWPPGIV